jgi:O-acetyl-ADP-ribose deacetylase (regulator of RNase III)
MSRFVHTFKGVKIKVVTGDITQSNADAIVNPANSSMLMGGGVAGAIKRAGGAEIEAEALKKAPVKVGDAIATKSGQLSAKFVIHTPTMVKPAMRIVAGNVRLAMHAALERARNLKVRNIAFPGLGTGVGGLPLEAAASIMMQELKKHLDKRTTLDEVVFVGHTADASEEFKRAAVRNLKNVG